MQRFNLKLGRLKFSAELKYRITVIDDESGKGKTCLFDAVKKFPGNRAVLTSSLKLQAVDSLNDIENNNEKKIILIDEDCNCLQKNNIKETITSKSASIKCASILLLDEGFNSFLYGCKTLFSIKPPYLISFSVIVSNKCILERSKTKFNSSPALTNVFA